MSKVDKYVMSDADYDAREDTYRKFKEERLREVRCDHAVLAAAPPRSPRRGSACADSFLPRACYE